MASKRGRKAKKNTRSFFTFRRKFLMYFNCGILIAGIAWYFFQPEGRKHEVNSIVGAYFRKGSNVNITELVLDIWQLYYGNAVQCDYAPAEGAPFGGIPAAPDNARIRLLTNQAYCVGYDEINRLPAWVSYRLFDSGNSAAPERPSEFIQDSRAVFPVKSEDYTGSGFDRGHLTPNYGIALCYGEAAQKETFLMTNIVPQKHAFNAGIWKQLEMKEANNYTQRFREIWVLAGPVFGDTVQRMQSGIPVPDGLFKIILDVQDSSIRTVSFIMPQNSDDKTRLQDCLCSIDRIEELTGLDFFPELSKEIQDALESQVPARIW